MFKLPSNFNKGAVLKLDGIIIKRSKTGEDILDYVIAPLSKGNHIIEIYGSASNDTTNNW